jgi:hypothetical protein
MRYQLFTYLGFAALTLGLTSACTGGQTGDLSGEQDDGPALGENSSGCEEHRQALDSFDEPTDAGTANELLAYAEGSFDAPLLWKTASQGQSWSVGPETGESSLQIDVARGTKAYFLTYEAKPSTSGIEIGIVCPPPQLGVEAHVSVTSEGGALAEEYDTLVRSAAAGIATIGVPVDLAHLGGTLGVSFSKPNAKLVQTRLEATLTSAGMTGKIAGIEQVDHGEVTSAMGAVLAVWPVSAACQAANQSGEGLGLGLEDEALGSTGAETLASVASPSPVDIRWRDGSETTLTVDITATGDGCLSVNPLPAEAGGGPNVVFPVTLTLKSADGRLEGEYAGSIVARGEGDSRVVTATAYLDLTPEQVSETGFAAAEVPAEADGVMVRIEASLEGGDKSGMIELVSYENPPCLTETPEPMETPGGGASVPGCAGQMRTQLEIASW